MVALIINEIFLVRFLDISDQCRVTLYIKSYIIFTTGLCSFDAKHYYNSKPLFNDKKAINLTMFTFVMGPHTVYFRTRKHSSTKG